MTRRVRFTPLSCTRTFAAVSFAAAALLGGPPAGAAEVPFATAAAISTEAGQPVSVASGDFDRDGDLDLVAGWNNGNRLAWLENVNGNGSAWTLRTIATHLNGIRSVTRSDVDGDGDLDVVATSFSSDAVVWCENTAGNGSAWLVRTISGTVDQAVTADAGDVDGDGDPDVLSGNAVPSTAAIHFHENAAGNGSTWTLRTIFQGANLVTAVAVADVDGDGDADALRASVNDATLAWHENLSGNGTLWAMRTISTAFQAQSMVPGDVDGDGDLDAVASNVAIDRVVWFDNLLGNGQAWTQRTISELPDGALGLVAGDLDGDGDLDVVGAGLTFDEIQWYENLAGDGSAWVQRTVGVTADSPYGSAIADIDGDGDLDVASAAGTGNQVAWFRNESIHKTACFGPTRTIFSIDSPFGGALTDIDRDGDLDAFATSPATSAVTWHRNDGDGLAWTAFTVAPDHGFFSVQAGDVDGDGDTDALVSSVAHPAAWIENVNDGATWLPHDIVTPGALPAPEPKPADIDGDGDMDAFSPAGTTDLLSWFENQDGQGDAWLRHTVATPAEDFGAVAADLDGDGDPDLVTASTPLAWHENTAGNGSAWTMRTIPGESAFAVGALDLDRDGDLDVIASNGFSSPPGIRWHENLAGNGTSWASHTVSTIVDTFGLELRDLDGDGDVDLVTRFASESLWFERTGPSVTFVPHTIFTTSPAFANTNGGDIDADGDPDLLWTSELGDLMAWTSNGRGQVVLDLLDQVPTTVSNNDVFPILRLTVTHGGRAGDSDLELARLGLLFEEQPGDPLNSAAANALVEELRIYRDANGNGTFDPGTDVLVATVPTLTLAAGVQTVTFADGDPNVQVVFGTPRTFFVVAQLTADASQQAPHQFRVTHLATGPSATRAEDRAADIPLTIACPADFASRLIVAVPVELMRFTIE